MLHAFRADLGLGGLREVNAHLLDPVIEKLDTNELALGLTDAANLPASCFGFAYSNGRAM